MLFEMMQQVVNRERASQKARASSASLIRGVD